MATPATDTDWLPYTLTRLDGPVSKTGATPEVRAKARLLLTACESIEAGAPHIVTRDSGLIVVWARKTRGLLLAIGADGSAGWSKHELRQRKRKREWVMVESGCLDWCWINKLREVMAWFVDEECSGR